MPHPLQNVVLMTTFGIFALLVLIKMFGDYLTRIAFAALRRANKSTDALLSQLSGSKAVKIRW
jgi:hypothetical protein